MKLVEIIPAIQTDQATIDAVMNLMESCGKTPVRAKDTPGFIVNRIARPYYSESIRIVEEQLATPSEMDEAMKTLGGFRMGPFELMDFIGHDVNYAVTSSVWSAMFYDDRYTPSHLQANLVRAGWLGRKTGRGFYEYREGVKVDVPARGNELQSHFERILVMLINEASDSLYKGIASRDDIEKAMTLGVNYPKGLLAWADELGIAKCVSQLDTLYDTYRESRYRCSPLLRQMAREQKTFF
jgi:3-hydroxybutyryl-CoA dehydrogenase